MENNIIIVDFAGNSKIIMNRRSVENLKKFVPEGCPFDGYNLMNLLMDLIGMYSWKIYRKIGIADFIRMLQNEGEAKSVAYGDAIINLI